MSYAQKFRTIEEYDAAIAETNRVLLEFVVDIVKRLAHDPCAEIEPQFSLIEKRLAGREIQICEKRRMEARDLHRNEGRNMDALV